MDDFVVFVELLVDAFDFVDLFVESFDDAKRHLNLLRTMMIIVIESNKEYFYISMDLLGMIVVVAVVHSMH